MEEGVESETKGDRKSGCPVHEGGEVDAKDTKCPVDHSHMQHNHAEGDAAKCPFHHLHGTEGVVNPHTHAGTTSEETNDHKRESKIGEGKCPLGFDSVNIGEEELDETQEEKEKWISDYLEESIPKEFRALNDEICKIKAEAMFEFTCALRALMLQKYNLALKRAHLAAQRLFESLSLIKEEEEEEELKVLSQSIHESAADLHERNTGGDKTRALHFYSGSVSQLEKAGKGYEAQFALSLTHNKAGDTLFSMNEVDLSRNAYGSCVELRRNLLEDSPSSEAAKASLAQALISYSRVCPSAKESKEGLQEAVEMLEKLNSQFPEDSTVVMYLHMGKQMLENVYEWIEQEEKSKENNKKQELEEKEEKEKTAVKEKQESVDQNKTE